MRLDITRIEFQTLIDALDGCVPKCNRQTAELLSKRLKFQLNGGDNRPPSFTPIRSPQLDAHVKPDKKSNWAFKPRTKTIKARNADGSTTKVKVQLTADEILTGL